MAYKKKNVVTENDSIRVTLNLSAKTHPELYLWLTSHINNGVMPSKLLRDGLFRVMKSGELPLSDSIKNVEMTGVLKWHFEQLLNNGYVVDCENMAQPLRKKVRKPTNLSIPKPAPVANSNDVSNKDLSSSVEQNQQNKNPKIEKENSHAEVQAANIQKQNSLAEDPEALLVASNEKQTHEDSDIRDLLTQMSSMG